MRSDPRRASDEATRHSPPRRSAALKRFCSRPGSSPACAGRRPDLEHLRPVGPRRVRLAVVAAAPRGRALELARLDHARAPAGIVVGERALPHVGDDLGIAMPAPRQGRPWRQPFLVENLEDAETIRERIRPVLRVERQPDLLLATAVVVTLRRSADGDHRPTPPSDSQRSRGSSPGMFENVTVNTPASSAARICLLPLLPSGNVNARVKPA